MCRCNPEIKTPYCGKPDCTWPAPLPSAGPGDIVPNQVIALAKVKAAVEEQRHRNAYLWIAPELVLSMIAEIELARAKLGTGCFANAAPGEPTFTLRGQDVLSPIAVRLWADMAALAGTCPPEKIKEARLVALAMEQWPARKTPD